MISSHNIALSLAAEIKLPQIFRSLAQSDVLAITVLHHALHQQLMEGTNPTSNLLHGRHWCRCVGNWVQHSVTFKT